jgi:hypothetical protein
VTVLDAIDEEDLIRLSDGFRPGRSAYGALDALSAGSWLDLSLLLRLGIPIWSGFAPRIGDRNRVR